MKKLTFTTLILLSFATWAYSFPPTPPNSGDVTGVGNCTGGACLDGSSDGGTQVSIYDGDSNKATLVSPNIAGDITITLPGATSTLLTTTGDGSTLTGIDDLTLIDTGDENATFYPVLVDGATGTQVVETDGELSYNPSTDTWTVGTVSATDAFIGADSDHSPDAVGELMYDNTVTGFTDGLWCWYDDDEVRYLVDIGTTLPTATGELIAYNATTDKWEVVSTLSGLTFGGFTASTIATINGDGNLVSNTALGDLNANGTIADDKITMAKVDDDGDFEDLTGNWVTTGTINANTKVVSIGNSEGVHDGDNNAALMTDSGESLTVDAYIGMTVYNITDGSSCTITDNAATTITCTLSGGTDDDWDTNDVWMVGPGPKQSGSVFFCSPGATNDIVHPATTGYSAMYFAGAAQTLEIRPASASMTLNFDDDGTFTDPAVNNEVDSDGSQGDFIVFLNASATEAYSLGVNGSWADGGALD